MSQMPTVGQTVHYVSHGTPNGEYPSVCRAAIITEVSGYAPPEHADDDMQARCHLAVMNPTGMFFNEVDYGPQNVPGTWHWPESVDEPGQVEPEPEVWNPYRERAALVAYLAAVYPSAIVPNADPDEPNWPVIYVTTPQGQLSWHLSTADLDLFPHVPVLDADQSPAWDGHTTAEKYERLAALTRDVADL
ncbi:hypothetical protein ACFQ08_04730 [Streptosporangium algeriense]|uniref:WDGH domain-containing protein n=1 Tax=Streptosporangium algeriense TaxID=1682748 RepID=A0ABW3DLJ6_9ACTN